MMSSSGTLPLQRSDDEKGATLTDEEGRALRKVLIVAPHFPPSNLAAVHRTRLFARHLPTFGWEPIVVTVHHDYYEEKLDWELTQLIPNSLRIERVGALPVRPVKLIGDIGIRGFISLCRRILRIIDRETIDFLYIPVPPFFAAPLGRVVHALRGIPYGIDYIDPWVHSWPPGKRRFTKHWASWKLGELIEPFAVREATLITGVAPGYFAGVLERNEHLAEHVVTVAMPYGGEQSDHRTIAALGRKPYLFDPNDGRIHLVYAGALLPRAFGPLEAVFRSIAAHRDAFRDVCFHFVGTGKSPDDAYGYNVRQIAERHGLWGDIVTEYPPRIPYLDVLVHLEAANAIFILGSTEPHYTPSKVFQGVLSGRPILAVLHTESTACGVLERTSAGLVLPFAGESELGVIEARFPQLFNQFRTFAAAFDPAIVDQSAFEPYTARSTTRMLADAMNRAIERAGSEELR